MKKTVFFAVVSVASASAACASILGIEDGILDNSIDADGGDDGGVMICESDSGLAVDTSQVFVSAGAGSDASGCGTDQSPCKSISAGIKALDGLRGATLIYVSDGIYNESVQVPKGVEIQGGWHTRGTNPSRQWVQVCPGSLSDPAQIANIVGVENTTVYAQDIRGTAILTNVVVKSRAPNAGESVFAIFASGSTTLVINQVMVQAGNGGDGDGGSIGAHGGVVSGSCSPGDGGAGASGTAGTNAPATTFGPNGSLPGNAIAGSDGNFGENGRSGGSGACAACVSCPFGAIGSSCGAASAPMCGAPGTAGCGGAAGGPGGPGQSGGSSIGIFAWGGAVLVNSGSIQSGRGGNGGVGGSGGNGGVGSSGEQGADGGSCPTTCVSAAACVSNGPEFSGSGGAAGGAGGVGGAGGIGGSGAGGDSYAIFSGLDASILLDGGAILQAGTPGAGGNGAASGSSQARFP